MPSVWKPTGWMVVKVEGGGFMGQDLIYHGRQGAARNAGIRHLRELGHHGELARLEQEAERWRRYREARKESKARRKVAVRAAVLAEGGRRICAYRCQPRRNEGGVRVLLLSPDALKAFAQRYAHLFVPRLEKPPELPDAQMRLDLDHDERKQ